MNGAMVTAVRWDHKQGETIAFIARKRGLTESQVREILSHVGCHRTRETIETAKQRLLSDWWLLNDVYGGDAAKLESVVKANFG